MKSYIFIFLLVLCSIASYAQNTLYIHTSGSLMGHNGSQLGVYGSIHNNGVLSSTGGQTYYTGSNAIVVSGDSVIQLDTMKINTTQDVQLLQELQVSGLVTFTNGNIQSDRNDSNTVFLHFLDNSEHSGAMDSSHVNGVVRKTGDDAFVFPLGNANHAQPIAISAPSSSTDQFTTFYRLANPTYYGMAISSLDSNCGGSNIVEALSEKEYWYLAQTSGNSSVIVTLHLDETSSVNSLTQVMPARWNGSQWRSIGNGGTTGTTLSGTISSGTGCGSVGSPSATDSFGFFTFSASAVSALPVDLIEFTAAKNGDDVRLNWSTAMQWNHSHFDIERSSDGLHFVDITTLFGESFTYETQHYETFDFNPNGGLNYYRLKQVDLDGSVHYSPLRVVHFDNMNDQLIVYPNPTEDMVFIQTQVHERDEFIEVSDAIGRRVAVAINNTNESLIQMDFSHLPTGVYLLKIGEQTTRILKH